MHAARCAHTLLSSKPLNSRIIFLRCSFCTDEHTRHAIVQTDQDARACTRGSRSALTTPPVPNRMECRRLTSASSVCTFSSACLIFGMSPSAVPEPCSFSRTDDPQTESTRSVPCYGWIHHSYRRAAAAAATDRTTHCTQRFHSIPLSAIAFGG